MESKTRLWSIHLGEVLAVNGEDRTVNVRWIGREGSRNNIPLMTNSDNYSMPRHGEAGLIVGDGREYYYLGKIEPKYRGKTSGKYYEEDKKISYPPVAEGEVHVSNIILGSYLRMFKDGGFGLMGKLAEGVEYVRNIRLTRLLGRTIELASSTAGTVFRVGVAKRNVPGKGEQPISGVSGGVALESFLQIAYKGIQTARFHLGEIKDLVAGVAPEPVTDTLGMAIMVLEVIDFLTQKGAYLKFDNLGNAVLKGDTNTMIDAGTLIQLGALLGAIHPAVKGDVLVAWLHSHTHPTAWGPSGPASAGTTGPVPVDALSTKVMVE